MDKVIYFIILEMDGVVIKGNVIVLIKYFVCCIEVVFMCFNNNIFYLFYKGYLGGILSIVMLIFEEIVIV